MEMDTAHITTTAINSTASDMPMRLEYVSAIGRAFHQVKREHQILSGKGFTFRPFVPLARMKGELGRVVVRLKAFGDVGHNFGARIVIGDRRLIPDGAAHPTGVERALERQVRDTAPPTPAG